ncbi:hypothetical protein GCM10027024_12480 [Microbacterium insulae]
MNVRMAFTREILGAPDENACTGVDDVIRTATSPRGPPDTRSSPIRAVVRGRGYAGDMAIARLHGGPLDGQLIPLEDPELDRLIVPYSETQVVYERKGSLENTGEGDGPTEAEFWFIEAQDDIDPYSDSPSDRR